MNHCHFFRAKNQKKGENCVRKYDFISALAQETAKEVVRNRDEWMGKQRCKGYCTFG